MPTIFKNTELYRILSYRMFEEDYEDLRNISINKFLFLMHNLQVKTNKTL